MRNWNSAFFENRGISIHNYPPKNRV
jgi:hypothetical protein